MVTGVTPSSSPFLRHVAKLEMVVFLPAWASQETEPQLTLGGHSLSVKFCCLATEILGLFVTLPILIDVISDVPNILRGTLENKLDT